jgi:predicted phage baseplate assembly protein
VSAEAPAAGLLHQDPHLALPQLRLTSTRREPSSHDEPTWETRRDLLGSGPTDQHVVVELDEAGRARLRFGDGELGRMPWAGTSFDAAYRIGNGAAGNVGAGVLETVVDPAGVLHGIELQATNPLAAGGGMDPEPLEQVKRLAPHAFRAQRLRAVVPEDYAELAGRTRGVQRAAAALRWTGSWYEVDVGIDALGTEDAPTSLLERVRQDLYPYRRIGHDLDVRPARSVALLLELDVCVRPEYLRAHVEAALRDAFGDRRLPDGRLGLFHPDRLTFGQGVYTSALLASAQAVPGVQSVLVTKLERLFEGPSGEVDAGVLKLAPTEVARLDNDPSVPEHGRLQLVMRGGR